MTLITSRDRLCESGITVEHYRLPGLDCQAWQHFFARHQLEVEPSVLAQIHKTYGGNATAMRILCGTIRADFDGNMVAYWHENHQDPLLAMELKNLVTHQFVRLQYLDPAAYHLLCRLGCYRYQDLARVPGAGVLALLWDVEPARQQAVIQSLRNRSLVEFHQGTYWLASGDSGGGDRPPQTKSRLADRLSQGC